MLRSWAVPIGTSRSSLENLLEGRGLVKKSAALALLSGMGAKLSRASDLPSPAARRETLPTTVPALDRLLEGGLPRGGFVEISSRRSAGRFSIGLADARGRDVLGRGGRARRSRRPSRSPVGRGRGRRPRAPPLGAAGEAEGRGRERGDAAGDGIPARRRGPRSSAGARPVRAGRGVAAPRARGAEAERVAAPALAVSRQRHRRRRRRRGRRGASRVERRRPRAAAPRRPRVAPLAREGRARASGEGGGDGAEGGGDVCAGLRIYSLGLFFDRHRQNSCHPEGRRPEGSL